MLHTRIHDQENLTHAHQVAGAAKTNTLPPKTRHQQPVGKTPARRVPLNDENSIFQGGKGKAKDLFQTPAPRQRAPLGAKTTNAKARPFTTPAAPLTGAKLNQEAHLKTPAQQRVASGRKNKLRIHHSPRARLEDTGPLAAHPDANTTTSNDTDVDDESEPEIETANRLPQPEMDDPVFDIQLDHSFPMLRPENIMRGAYELYLNPVGDDGLTLYERQGKERDEKDEAFLAEYERRLNERARQDVMGGDWSEQDRAWEMASRGIDPILQMMEAEQAEKKGPVSKRAPPTEAACKSAASALSVGPRSTQQRSASTTANRFAAPTTASLAKEVTIAKSTSHDGSSLKHNRTNRNAKPMVSRTTIGRAQGRKVSAEVRAGKPKMEDRKNPSVELRETKAQSEESDQEENFLEVWKREYDKEQAKKAGVEPNLAGQSLRELEEALNQSMSELTAEEFQLDLPEGVEPFC